MKGGGFSQMFWIVLATIIAVPISIDRILASYTAPKAPALTKAKSQFDWQHKEFPELGIAVDLPCAPQADQPADFGPRIESYAGAIDQIYYKFGRHTVDSANPFDAKTYLAGEVATFTTTPGNTDVKGDIHKIEWFGVAAYEADITCSRFGKPMRVHFRVRGTDHDWVWLSSMYQTKVEAAGEHAWRVIVDSFAIDRKLKEEPQSLPPAEASSQPLGFDQYRFNLPCAGIQFAAAARLSEDSSQKNRNWGDLIYQDRPAM